MTGVVTPKGITILFHLLASSKALCSGDFECIATISKNRRTWAHSTLQQLSGNGLIYRENSAKRRQRYRISRLGIKACLDLEQGFTDLDVVDGRLQAYGAQWQVFRMLPEKDACVISFASDQNDHRSLVFRKAGDRYRIQSDHYF